ncbi:MAG: glycoside hydrolase family 57 [Gammaproteobacteria bacterium]|nr:glycoside hydrolase family 57 [Gammaproteobacteria bacterium]
MNTTYHALVLNFHQPEGNLEELLGYQPWDTEQILYAMERMPRTLLPYQDQARVHLSLSGTLLQTLSDPGFQERVYGIVDCGSLLWQLQNNRIFNILGTGYYHPVLPLIPETDRIEHLQRWKNIAEHLFWRTQFEGFWPPEMSFSMELIPLIKQMGYQYVLVDSSNVEPLDSMSWQELRYRPHIARYEDHEIIVVVRDRELSDAQESGMDFGWFSNEVYQRTKDCNFAPLVTTCTDGDNGGWFRNTTEGSNFWTGFYTELLDSAKDNVHAIQPTFIHDYINKYGAQGEVRVDTAAWNTGWHNGKGFVQWTGSQPQKDALERVKEVSADLVDARQNISQDTPHSKHDKLEQAMHHLLKAETSCNFYWGEAWVDRCHKDLNQAIQAIQQIKNI